MRSTSQFGRGTPGRPGGALYNQAFLQSQSSRIVIRFVCRRTPRSAHLGPERRSRQERRSNVVRALLYGSFRPRRQSPRRDGERQLGAVDWYHPWWLALAILILLLSCVDAALTLVLISRGASEVNPVLAPLVHGSPVAFVLVKVGLTGIGLVCLTLLARMRVFGRLPAQLLLYAILLGYVVLIVYELKLIAVR